MPLLLQGSISEVEGTGAVLVEAGARTALRRRATRGEFWGRWSRCSIAMLELHCVEDDHEFSGVVCRKISGKALTLSRTHNRSAPQ